MTHNRKPDVLPVEGASIAEALEALGRLPSLMFLSSRGAAQVLSPIRSALERAAAEGEAWRVIEEWQLHPRKTVSFAPGIGLHTVTLQAHDAYYNPTTEHLTGDTRLEALQSAAEWVKAQALPAPPKGSTP